jgi:excisionase family DNA binding protein
MNVVEQGLAWSVHNSMTRSTGHAASEASGKREPSILREEGERLLLTLEQAAETLSIGRTKLYELLAAGALRSVRIDRSRRIPMSALLEFVEDLQDDKYVETRTGG